MEFILISEDKIKVTLTEADLDEFELSAEELDYANTETKRMFWDVLSRAKARTGFDTDGQRVLVQLYPSRGGGCEIFVTKIGSIYKETGDDLFDAHTHSISLEGATRRRKKPGAADRMRSTVYSFSSLEDMIRVCRELDRRGYKEESLAYISDMHVFYLILFSASAPDELYPFIAEFGEEESAKSIRQMLSEHADVIKKTNAVSALALC